METDCCSDELKALEAEKRAEESVVVLLMTGCIEGQHISVIDLDR